MNALDKDLLSIIQRRFPVLSDPYAKIASELNIRPAEIMNKIAAMKDKGIIRQISAIFDPPAVGYRTCLVALSVDPSQIQQAISVINHEPGVSHNYLREDEFNIWFTIAIPPDCDLNSEVQSLSERAMARKSLILPARKLFKIAVVMNMRADEAEEQAFGMERERNTELKVPSARDIELIRCVQEDLPLTERPFLAWAESVSAEETELIRWIEAQLASGTMRRFAALLRHHKVGYLANAMVAWNCPPELIETAGRGISSHSEVTHCYEREPAEEWPYNLYAMVHGKEHSDCEKVVEKLKKNNGLGDCKVLYTVKELKKERLKLFWKRQSAPL